MTFFVTFFFFLIYIFRDLRRPVFSVETKCMVCNAYQKKGNIRTRKVMVVIVILSGSSEEIHFNEYIIFYLSWTIVYEKNWSGLHQLEKQNFFF